MLANSTDQLSASSEGPDDDKDHDGQQKQDRDLIEPAIEHVPANVLVTSKPLQLCAAYVVIADQYKDQRQLGVKPAACTEQTGIQNDHPYAKHQRGDHRRKHDAAVKLTLHDLEALSTGLILTSTLR